MALTFGKLFASKQVNNAAVDTLLTVPTSPATSVLRNGRVRFANTTGTAATIKGWAVPAAGAADDSNVFLPTVSVPANGYVDVDVPAMAAGDILQAQAGTASAITASCIDGFIQS